MATDMDSGLGALDFVFLHLWSANKRAKMDKPNERAAYNDLGAVGGRSSEGQHHG